MSTSENTKIKKIFFVSTFLDKYKLKLLRFCVAFCENLDLCNISEYKKLDLCGFMLDLFLDLCYTSKNYTDRSEACETKNV